MHVAEVLPPLLALATYAAAFGMRARTLARRRRPVPGARKLAFGTGILVVALAQAPPLDDLSDRSLTAHMVQHLLIGDIGAFLVAIGLTGPLLAPLLRVHGLRWLRPFAHPAVALTLWALNFYAWHLPVLYQGALRHDALHALEHATFFWFGLALWIALLGPLPKPRWFGGWAQLGYVVAVRFSGTVLANVLIWSESLLYPHYAGAGALGDQSAAGALMMIEQMLLTVLLLGWLFLRIAERDERSQQVLDLAASAGAPISQERAERAAAAGATGRLSERLRIPPDAQGRGRSGR